MDGILRPWKSFHFHIHTFDLHTFHFFSQFHTFHFHFSLEWNVTGISFRVGVLLDVVVFGVVVSARAVRSRSGPVSDHHHTTAAARVVQGQPVPTNVPFRRRGDRVILVDMLSSVAVVRGQHVSGLVVAGR
jgi:hypothetical protein